MPFFIRCDPEPYTSGNEFLYCRVSEGAQVLTEQEVIDLYASQGNGGQPITAAPQLTAEEGALFASVIFTTSLLAWGFRLALKQYNLGV